MLSTTDLGSGLFIYLFCFVFTNYLSNWATDLFPDKSLIRKIIKVTRNCDNVQFVKRITRAKDIIHREIPCDKLMTGIT